MEISQHTWRRDALLLLVAIGLFFCIGLGARPYLTPSEARYIELPRQMLATGDWLTPRIDGVPYFEKPPLFYWLQASVMGLLGNGEFAGRIATAFIATLLCLLTYATGRLLHERRSGVLAALVLATSVMGYGLSRVAMLDMPVSVFLTLCFACFLAAQKAALPQRRYFYWAMYAAAALAMLTKGLIGIVIPGLVIGAWIALSRRWHLIKEAQLLPGLAIFLAIVAPWHALMALRHPDFLNFYFIHEHFTRYLTDSHKRGEPWFFFTLVTLAGLLPWTGLLPAALKSSFAQRQNPGTLFLLSWVFLPLLFFSASHSQLVPYILPIFPPLAILIGNYLAALWVKRLPSHHLRYTAMFTVALFAVAIVGYYTLPLPKNDDNKIAFTALSTLTLLPIILALMTLSCVIVRRSTAPALIAALALLGIITDLAANYSIAALDRATVKPLLAMKGHLIHANDAVVAFGSYFQDLPVYLNRNVTVAGWQGELEFGATHYPETQPWMISADEFWQGCPFYPHDIFVFMKKTTFSRLSMPRNCPLHVIAEYGKTVLLERHPQ